MFNVLEAFKSAVDRYPDRVAIVDRKGIETTFAQLQSRADGFARTWHSQGITSGDRVLLAMPLGADLYASLAALWSLGASVVLPEPAMGIAGLRHAARTANVRAFCSAGAFGALKYVLPELWTLRHLRPAVTGGVLDLPPPSPTSIALISFTSGTTGAPKAIPRSHRFLAAQHRAIAPLLDSETAQRDLVAFPVFVLINIACGRTSILPNWNMSRLGTLPPEAVADWIETQSITRALIPPALCDALGRSRIPPSLTTIFTGGGPVFPSSLARLKTLAPRLEITCVYGSTEAEPIAHLNAAQMSQADHAAMTSGHGLLVGHQVPDLQLRIVADEIQVAGPHVNGGYLDPKQDADNKIVEGDVIWHRTGDAGRLDPQGRLWLLGRIGSQVDMREGAVFPFCIEVAARGWPGVTQCALIDGARGACLVIEGAANQRPMWQTSAEAIGITEVIWLRKIPMDRRHASKIDRTALRRMRPR